MIARSLKPLFWLGLSFTLVGISVWSGCGGESTGTVQQFKQWADSYVRNPHSNVLIPNPENWFNEHFAADVAPVLMREYFAQTQESDGLPNFVRTLKRRGNTEVHARVAIAPIDEQANGLQNAALQRMTKRTSLYTLTMTVPGEPLGTTIWSFVKVDGKFYYVGKMASLNPTRGDLALDILCNMSLSTAGPLLREKGLINTDAVDFLKAKGILH